MFFSLGYMCLMFLEIILFETPLIENEALW